MLYRFFADLTLIMHFGFIVFVLIGGLLCFFKKGVIWLHLPAVIWGICVEWNRWICPLTPLENYFREKSHMSGFTGSFTEHYLVPILYPDQLTNTQQWLMGGGVLIVNLIVYGIVFGKIKKSRSGVDE